MGTWGPGGFQSDTALDWLTGLSPASSFETLEEVLVPVARGEGLDDPYDCEVALAAAELVALARGAPSGDVPEEAASWVSRQESGPPPELLRQAREAVRRLVDASELREMWSEHDVQSWVASVEGLLERLA